MANFTEGLQSLSQERGRSRSCLLYTSNNTFLAEEPETARAFLDAVSRGYEFAIEHPQEAGDILCLSLIHI